MQKKRKRRKKKEKEKGKRKKEKGKRKKEKGEKKTRPRLELFGASLISKFTRIDFNKRDLRLAR
jgi:hypothetical protein